MAQLENIEAIEKRLWNAADNLRANSNYASNEYFMPVMRLIFLRHAYSRYLAVSLDQHLFHTLYHAVALVSPDCTLVTADERYYNKAHKERSIALLRDFDPAKAEYRR